MTDPARHICIVEDDGAVRDALARLLRDLGHTVYPFESAEEFEARRPATPCGCLLLDVRLPGDSGIVLHEKLRRRGARVPVVFLTGHGDVPLAVAAMKKGAVDFLIKPVDEEVLVAAVEQALATHTEHAEQDDARQQARVRLARLTPRERDVLREVVTGAPNKEIADRLGIALKTVKIHRGRVIAKMEATSVVELAQLAVLAQDDPRDTFHAAT